MVHGRCGAPGCEGRYIGRGTCTNPRCVDPHGPGRRDHPEHWHRRRSRSPYPLPKRMPRPWPSPLRLQQIREAAPRCVACMQSKPQVCLEPCGCVVVCTHCVGVIMAIATDNSEDILAQCPHCRAGFHGVKMVTTLSKANSRKTPAAEILQWEVGTNFRITGPNGSWHPAKTGGWQPQFYSGWPDDWPRSQKVTRDMVDVDLDSIFIVKEIRRCGEFVTVEVQEWNYGGVHLKTNIQKGQETWAERVEHDPEPQSS